MSGTMDPNQFASAMAAYRDAMRAYIRCGNVPVDFVKQLGAGSQSMNQLGYHQEAYEVIQLIMKGTNYINDSTERVIQTYRSWKAKASTSSFLGLWRESIDSYEKTINLGEQGAYARIEESHAELGRDAVYEPTDHRELGSMHGRVGAFGEARESFSIAEERLEAVRHRLDHHTHRDESARLLNARAIVHADLGEYEEAESNALSAAQIQEVLGEEKPGRFLQAAIDYVTAGRARRELARREDEDYTSSFEAFDDALRVLDMVPEEDRDREHSDRESEARLQRGRTQILDGDYDAAIEDLEKALSLSSDFNLVQHAGEHRLYLGEAHLELDDPARARKNLEEAVELAEGNGTPETLWRGRYALASVHRAEDRPEEARSELKKCVETIERLRSQHLPESSKISMLDLKDRPYEELIVDLCQPRADGPEAPKNAEALAYAERSKSRVLTERLATKDVPAPAGVPEELVAEERQRAGNLRALQDSGSRGNAARGAYDLQAKVEEAERRLREVREKISACGVRGEEYVSMREGAPLDYAGIRNTLASTRATIGPGHEPYTASERAERVVLVDYFVAEEKILVFIGRSDFEKPRAYEVEVSRDALQVWADEVFAKVKTCNYENLWDLQAWQSEMGRLVAPIEECSEEGDVVWIVPHRELHRLPLHALKLGGRYLADRNPVFYTPSASVFRYSRAKNPGRVPETALVLGNSLPRTRPLDFAEGEAVAVAALFGTNAYLRNRATKAVLYEALRRAGGEIDVLHFACHGGFDAEAPLESRVELATSGGEEDEQPDLNVEDVLGLELKATLVGLSACDSGLSKIYPGEELIGLTRSFLYTGTPSLLVSLWSVHDRSTGELMERFYKVLLDPSSEDGVATRTSKAHALQIAQRGVRSNGRFDHPFHWSSFVLEGDWD
ncbi:CHAT domain-containing protein [Rubrobacter aplysinae]|uniref:CHAT domain-containing protein n=1 Tax=Rubrobacter aplysinae TaxID=909625 RepID=UPI00064C16C8|nr:CHAT domain-containing protein [Rubrobacter aplysinae]